MTPRMAHLCLLFLIGESAATELQIKQLEALGLFEGRQLTPDGFIVAYRLLAQIGSTGSSANREVIAAMASEEAEAWKAVKESARR